MDRFLKDMDDLPTWRPEGFEGEQLFRVPPAVLKRMRARPHTRDFLVTDLGYFPLAVGHKVSRQKGTAAYILILVEAGRGTVTVCGQRFAIAQGQVALLPPHCAHAYEANPEDPWKIYWFHFTGAGAEALLAWTGLSESNPVQQCPAAEGMRRHFRTILATAERGYSDHTLLELSRSLINVLSLLHVRNLGSPQPDRHAARIEQIMDYMRETLDDPRSLAFYASRCGLCVSRFSEAFREHCGVSPMVYLTELRIQRASLMLESTDLQVGEIARRLGFEDPLYFSRLFRQQTGLAPTAFRKCGME